MNRQDIIRMVKEAGLELDGENIFSPKSDPQVDVHIADLEAFAALVVSDEREACAKVCEKLWDTPANGMATEEQSYGNECAEAIRARKQA